MQTPDDPVPLDYRRAPAPPRRREIPLWVIGVGVILAMLSLAVAVFWVWLRALSPEGQ
jgi:hypothetical protein